jgi:hypothetical protein
MKKRIFCLAIFVGIMMFSFDSVKACVCGLQTACQSYASANVVFVAKVIDSKIEVRDLKHSEDPREVPFKAKFQISRLQIKESFIGIESEIEIEIETDNYSSCSFSLAKDVEYLVFGDKDPKSGKFTTSFCSGTKPIADAKEELDYLRSVKNAMGMSVKGSVVYSPKGDYLYGERIPKNNFNTLLKLGVTTISLVNSEQQFQTQIQSDGTYKFENIPKGKYQLKPLLPTSLFSLESYHPDIAKEFGIEDQSLIELTGRGCQIEDFTIVNNGRVSGKVIDANGKPVADISVNLVPVSTNRRILKTEDACYDIGLCLNTDESGKFSFNGIPEGHYLIGTRLDGYVGADSIDAAYPTTYFPNSKTRNTAKIITVRKETPIQNLEIKLFPQFREITVEGLVYFKDGRPASKVSVRYAARTPDYKDSGIVFIETDENGYFSFAGYENHSYLIGSFTDQRQGNANAYAIEQEIFIKGSPKELKFILDRTGNENCKECRDYMDFPNRPKLRKK